MDNFNNYLKKKNMKEIKIYLKNSSVDFLKSLAKRYKLPVSTKKKELILSDILQAINNDKPLQSEPSIHVMTISQLRNKAKELNIDFSSIKLKQDLRMAILRKMQSNNNNDDVAEEDIQETQLSEQKELQSKTLAALKQIAKTYKIKISKLSKNQIITLILQAKTSGQPQPSESTSSTPKDLNKLTKNELIMKAEELNIDHKKQSKKELLNLIKNKMGIAIETTSTTTSSNIEPTLPITKEAMQQLLHDKKFTVLKVKEILKKHSIRIPKGSSKRDDLIKLLHSSSTSFTVPTPTPTPVNTPENTPTPRTPRQQAEPSTRVVEEAEVVEQRLITSNEDADIVSVDDISTPFHPVPLNDLLEAPSEKQLQDELYRCLQFYEYPK